MVRASWPPRVWIPGWCGNVARAGAGGLFCVVVGVVGRRGGPGEGDASEKWGKRDVYPPGEVVWVREMHPRSGKKEMHIRPERLARDTRCIREVGKVRCISARSRWSGA